VKFPTHKGPNPAKRTVSRLQRGVNIPIVELYKFFHTPLVEKQGAVGLDLQRSRKFECQAPQENAKQKNGFP